MMFSYYRTHYTVHVNLHSSCGFGSLLQLTQQSHCITPYW